MRCPFCGDENTQVKDSRPSEDGESIKRRRFCSACMSKFVTIERVQLRELFVVKKNGEREIFDQDKIYRAISTALRKRNISEADIERLVNKIVHKLEKNCDFDIPTPLIGEEIMDNLKEVDQVGYIRFASVYKDFSNPKDFANFIAQLRTATND